MTLTRLPEALRKTLRVIPDPVNLGS